MDDLVPLGARAFQVDLRSTDTVRAVRHVGAERREPVAVLESLLPRTPLETQRLLQSHREIGVAVSVGGKLCDVQLLVADHALDRGTGLALIVDHEGLCIEHSPPVADVEIEADRRCLVARIQPCLPDALGGLQAHHVGGREVRSTQGDRNRMAVHEIYYCAARIREATLIGCPAHRLAHVGCRVLRNLPRGSVADSDVPRAGMPA